MTYTVTKLTILVAIATISYGNVIGSDLCEGCTIVNGAGYKKHATDCDKYIQCHLNGLGVLKGEVRQCPFSTFWCDEKLTCLSVEEARCASDQCQGVTDKTIFGAAGNCRGYWECTGNRSVAKCCPLGQRYDGYFGCIDNVDNKCTDSCFNDMSVVPEVEPEAEAEAEAEISCDKQEHANKGKFQQMVEGHGWVSMSCAPGTEYVHHFCRCEGVVAIPLPERQTCKAEVHLPFTGNTNDHSGNGYYIGNTNVEVRDGVAIFNGVNSSLVIPRFTNLGHSTTVVIKVKYISNPGEYAPAMAIVSNADCGIAPSILISEDHTHVYCGIATNEHKFTELGMPQVPNSSIKEIMYEFDNGALKLTTGYDVKTKPVSGYLQNVKCGLQVGHAEGMDKFHGKIDELTVYLCNPKK